MKKVLISLSAVWLLASTGEARDLEDILKEKKVIDASEANEAKAAKEAAQASTDKAVQSIPALPGSLKMVTLSGDVRVRNEAFFREGDEGRNRNRFRLRFGAKVKPNDETELGFRLASGNANDPISNNQTFTDSFTSKTINITNAYLKLAPAKSVGLERPWLTLMGGKFDVPFYSVPSPSGFVFDRDLTPEGFYESLKLVEEKEGAFRGLALNLGQWIFEENSSSGEALIFAFQGVANFALGDILWNIGVADYNYQKASSIAVQRNRNTSLNITNTVTLSDGTVVGGRVIDPTKFGPDKKGVDADGKAITIQKFNSEFNVLDFATDLMIPTGAPAWPLKVFFNYLNNTDASGSDDQGFLAGAGIGGSKDPGDLAFSYAYARLETDAVVSAFSDSDFGRDGGTNTKAHILQLGYVLWKNLSLVSTAWIDKPIDNVSGRSEETDYRWQADAIAKF
ncbi:MAG: putative porin [Candidatus Binatia bacterium]